jgi:hypothetical protein
LNINYVHFITKFQKTKVIVKVRITSVMDIIVEIAFEAVKSELPT